MSRDPQDFSEMVSRYAKPVYGFLSAFLEVGCQRKHQLMLGAFTEGFRTFRPEKPSRPLLLLILRSLWKEMAQEHQPAASEGMPATPLHIQWILELFTQLSREEKTLILLRTQMDLLYQEMAFVFSMSEARVKSKLKAAQLHFRKIMAESMKGKYRELQRSPRPDSKLS